jgi:hypothetical protein
MQGSNDRAEIRWLRWQRPISEGWTTLEAARGAGVLRGRSMIGWDGLVDHEASGGLRDYGDHCTRVSQVLRMGGNAELAPILTGGVSNPHGRTRAANARPLSRRTSIAPNGLESAPICISQDHPASGTLTAGVRCIKGSCARVTACAQSASGGATRHPLGTSLPAHPYQLALPRRQ